MRISIDEFEAYTKDVYKSPNFDVLWYQNIEFLLNFLKNNWVWPVNWKLMSLAKDSFLLVEKIIMVLKNLAFRAVLRKAV